MPTPGTGCPFRGIPPDSGTPRGEGSADGVPRRRSRTRSAGGSSRAASAAASGSRRGRRRSPASASAWSPPRAQPPPKILPDVPARVGRGRRRSRRRPARSSCARRRRSSASRCSPCFTRGTRTKTRRDTEPTADSLALWRLHPLSSPSRRRRRTTTSSTPRRDLSCRTSRGGGSSCETMGVPTGVPTGVPSGSWRRRMPFSSTRKSRGSVRTARHCAPFTSRRRA